MEIYFRIGKDQNENEKVEFNIKELKLILNWDLYDKEPMSDSHKLDIIRGLVDEYEIKTQGIRVE